MAALTRTGTVPAPRRGLGGRMRALLGVVVLGGSLALGGCSTPEGNAALLGAGLGVLVGVAIASDHDDDHYHHHRRGHRHGYYHQPRYCPYGY